MTMATQDYWADSPIDRRETPLGRWFPTLDAIIAPNDPVRLVDEVLQVVDWSDWEDEYPRQKGQPPIHPKHVAAAILYGMYRGIRSSRKLEEACNYRFDFIWLVEGRHIDHTTFSKFRTRFRQPLKDLFKQIGRIAMTLGLIRLGEVGFDATRVKANNSRFATRTAKTLEEKLQALDELFEHLLNQLNEADAEDLGSGDKRGLPDELAQVDQRRQRVQEALEQARVADEARQRQGIDPQKNPAQVPTTDPESHVMPNKEGGYAPNYTPVATTDGERGFIVDCDVLSEVNEGPAALPSVDHIAETFGQSPERFLTDGGNNSGQIMAGMEQRDIEAYTPVESNQPQPGNPALRDDPHQPVPSEAWAGLPRNSQKQLDKSCFVYNESEDQYYCPQGHAMPYEQTKREERGGETVSKRIYRCHACAGCPLAAVCLSPRSKRGRTITRDQYEEVRERTAARMATPAGRQIFRHRSRIAETPFGIIKSIMGLRQFLLRGLDKVKTEWLWTVTAFNLIKLARAIGQMRAEFAELLAEA
jgi:transposase